MSLPFSPLTVMPNLADSSGWPQVSSWGPRVSAQNAPGVRDLLAKGMGFYNPWQRLELPHRKDGKETPGMTGDSPQDSREPEAEGSPTGGVDARPKKTEKGPVAKVAPGPSKERLKAGASGFAGGRGEVGAGYGLAWGVSPGLGLWTWGQGETGCNGSSWLTGVQVSQAVTKRAGSLC